MGHITPVIEVIEQVGDELEYSLHEHLGLDLLDVFRGHYTWAKVLRLAEHLPWYSRYQLALADNDELAARQLDADGELSGTGTGQPSIRAWDPHRELNAIVTDGFNRLLHQQSGKKGSKPPKPTPRPQTARDRVEKQREQATVSELFATFTPGR